jgi:hypothetical protein
MKKILAAALVAIGSIVGTLSTTGCMMLFLDEPEYPESLD